MAALLVDTNLLVLLVVGSVNPDRIETFKRTRRYSRSDFDLLERVLRGYQSLVTVPHILAEVSNLTDLNDEEGIMARLVLKKLIISDLDHAPTTSLQGAEDPDYWKLGLTDAVIKTAALTQGCAVLTDDHDLYRLLIHCGVKSYNFNHFRARE